jgi:hypothetical protein
MTGTALYCAGAEYDSVFLLLSRQTESLFRILLPGQKWLVLPTAENPEQVLKTGVSSRI